MMVSSAKRAILAGFSPFSASAFTWFSMPDTPGAGAGGRRVNTAGVPVYTVSQVNGYVKDLMDDDPLLAGLLVRGEVSNYKCYPSGHHYFSQDAQHVPHRRPRR